MEQGLVESRHRETQKIIGILVTSVLEWFPMETGELLHVVELVVYNTPAPPPCTPRNVGRPWSLSAPLDKELLAFVVNQFEPISEYTRQLISNYKQIRIRVLGWLRDPSEKRANLSNRCAVPRK